MFEGGFNRMTLLVTEKASFTVWISSCPCPWDSSLWGKENQHQKWSFVRSRFQARRYEQPRNCLLSSDLYIIES